METEEKLPGPVILDVEPISCSLRMTRTRDAAEQLPDSLSMRLQLARRIELRTPDNRSLNAAEWAITFYENGSGNKYTELHKAIGLINYHEEEHYEQYDIDDSPEACYAWANLDSPTFALLRDMALAGKLPAAFRLEAWGIDYGWEPDGSSRVWDVKTHKNAVISKVEVISNLVKLPEARENDEKEVDSFWIESKPESQELLATRAMTKAIAEVNTRLGWMLGFLAVAVATLIFR